MRLGDLDALKKALKSNCDLCPDKNTNWCEHCCPHNDFEDLIDNAPTVHGIVGFVERPKGEWLEIPVERDLLYNTGIKYTCSICGSGNCYGKPPFCMYCGADMRGGENEID